MFNAAFTHCQLLAFAVIAPIDCLSKLFRHCEPAVHNYYSLLNTLITLNPAVSGEIFGQNQPRSYCLQVQPVTC